MDTKCSCCPLINRKLAKPFHSNHFPLTSRLASTSSVDLLSPEPIDAFSSPPLTPSLSTISLHDQSSNDHTSSPPWSNLPKLSFEVTPYLHPKYLLADFALPRKKVFAVLSSSFLFDFFSCRPSSDNGKWNSWNLSGPMALAPPTGYPMALHWLVPKRWKERKLEREVRLNM